MTDRIDVTFDYLCPFARNAHEAIVAALKGGTELEIGFRPFSLNQAHVEEGATPVWERPPDKRGSGVAALTYGLAARDEFPDQFLDFHVAVFAQRHDHGRQLDEAVLDETAAAVGIDVAKLKAVVGSGTPLATLAKEHVEVVERWSVFGVPTFILGDDAVFIRFMERGRVDDLERAVDLLDWNRLNEFKHTRIPR